MDEQFLHYIWKYQKFRLGNLHLTNGQPLTVFNPGNHNHDSGPDFEEARLKIDDIEWAGQVEIHLKSSDWLNHNHQNDEAYESVILHVVWDHNKEIYIQNEQVPTLELKNLIDPGLIEKYRRHTRSTHEILCANQIEKISTLTVSNMLDRVAIERLKGKADEILNHLATSKNDWEQVTYRTVATNFGFSTNKETFTRLAQLLPFGKLKKVLQSQQSTEAMLFGQSGFLEETADEYQTSLKTEYGFLRKKLNLNEPLSKSHWKFGKLRPANFPSVRLAQLSALLHEKPQLFTFLTKAEDANELKNKFLIRLNPYWQQHYDFGKPRKRPSMTVGKSSVENILINSVAPILAAYSKYLGEQMYMDRAIEILESVSAENNRITKKWDSLGINSKSAFDSQALIQLHKNYCLKRRCLHCNIGVEILNK